MLPICIRALAGPPKMPVPPGNKPVREKGKEIDADNSPHIGPKYGFEEGEFKLHNDQGKGHGKFDRTE